MPYVTYVIEIAPKVYVSVTAPEGHPIHKAVNSENSYEMTSTLKNIVDVAYKAVHGYSLVAYRHSAEELGLSPESLDEMPEPTTIVLDGDPFVTG